MTAPGRINSFCPEAPFANEKAMVQRIGCILILAFLGLLTRASGAETYNLVSGEVVSGEMLVPSANDLGVQIKIAEGEYQRVSWAQFSQEDLKKLAENPKLQPFVEPFIEVTQAERIARTEVPIKPPPRLERPPRQSLFGALFSSALGVFLLFVLYAANLYAAYEVSVYRAQPAAMVCGAAAVLPVLAPIVFLSMPTKLKQESEAAPAAEAAEGAAGAPVSEGVPAEDQINPMLDTHVAHPAGLKLAHEPEPAKPGAGPVTSYQRGQFTFNRRFFETKFPGFFGSVRRDADRGMVLVFKCSKGEHVGDRITRISANDLHLQVHRGHVAEEVAINFQDIVEVRLKPRDA
jgi:hypothetical protein